MPHIAADSSEKQAELAFRPVKTDDLPMIDAWLHSEQIGKWWGDPDKQLAKISDNLDEAWLIQEMILLGGEPVGYIQHYDCAEDPAYVWEIVKEGTWAVDLLIGKKGMVSKGVGTRALKACCARIFTNPGAARVIIDPMPDNARAIRCYEKAGFERLGILETPNYTALLMVMDKPE